jgi:hypothetical protein
MQQKINCIVVTILKHGNSGYLSRDINTVGRDKIPITKQPDMAGPSKKTTKIRSLMLKSYHGRVAYDTIIRACQADQLQAAGPRVARVKGSHKLLLGAQSFNNSLRSFHL